MGGSNYDPKFALPELPVTNAVALDDASVSLYHSSGRRVRSERLEAARTVMGVFLRHLDPGTLCVGHWSPQGDFIPLDMGAISSEAGLCRRRCERAILYLKKFGFVVIFPPQHHYNPLPHVGLRVLRAVTPAFFEWAGLSDPLDRVWPDSIRRIEGKGGGYE